MSRPPQGLSPARLGEVPAGGLNEVAAVITTVPWLLLNIGLQLGDRLPASALQPTLDRLGLRSTDPEILAKELDLALERCPPDPAVIAAILSQLRKRLAEPGPEGEEPLRRLGLGLERVLEAPKRPKDGQVAAGPLARFALRSS